MLILKTISKNPQIGDFVIPTGTNANQYAEHLGFIDTQNVRKSYKDQVEVYWFHRTPNGYYSKLEKATLNNLIVVTPYYKNGKDKQGEIAKSSYKTLFEQLKYSYFIRKINTLCEPNDIVMIACKNRAKRGDTVKISCADVVFTNKLQTLIATIDKINESEVNHKLLSYDLKLQDSLETVLSGIKRSQFVIIPQDEYLLATLRCDHCGCFANKQ